MQIELGFRYRDKVTGFVGVATGHCEYITGCSQTLLVSEVTEKKDSETHWYDDQRLEKLESARIVLDNEETPGCDAPAPIR